MSRSRQSLRKPNGIIGPRELRLVGASLGEGGPLRESAIAKFARNQMQVGDLPLEPEVETSDAAYSFRHS